MVTTVIGGYLLYIATNLQWLYNEYDRVGYVNLADDQETWQLFIEHVGDAKGACRIYQEGYGYSTDGWQLLHNASVTIIITHDYRLTENYGVLWMVREA